MYRVGVGEEETSRGCVRKKLAVSAYSAARARLKSCSADERVPTKSHCAATSVEITLQTVLTITGQEKKV